MRGILFIVMAIALAACSTPAKSDLERNREKWQDAGISHYRFGLFVGCFCAFNQNMPLAIEVKDGEVVSMEYRSGNPIDEVDREYFAEFATIDRLFTELEAGLGGEADEVTVTYDPSYGFPTQISID